MAVWEEIVLTAEVGEFDGYLVIHVRVAGEKIREATLSTANGGDKWSLRIADPPE